MGKRLILFMLLISVVNIVAAQNELPTSGTLRAHLTISPAKLFGSQQSDFYLHGSFEGYLTKKISLSGDGFYSLGSISGDKNIFEYNHSLFFGSLIHFTKNNNDVYVGFQPGLSFTKLNAVENNLEKTRSGVNPLLSTMVGYNYFVNKVFHFFVQARLVFGDHHYDIQKSLNEFRFSAGLGFNFSRK